MKISAAVLLSATAASAFQAGPIFPRATQTSALSMGGFLEGKGAKITVREDEDNAMWIDDGSGGRGSAAATKKPDPKKPVKKDEPKKSGGFKFPWDK
jgi:hypothetical protein